MRKYSNQNRQKLCLKDKSQQYLHRSHKISLKRLWINKKLKYIFVVKHKMQHLFFKSNLKTMQLEKYLQSFKQDQNYQNLKAEIKSTVKVLEQFVDQGSDEEKSFFRNYEKLISLIYDQRPEDALNFSLHWINLYGQRLIEINNIKEATSILQCALNFSENPSVDSLLFCTALNNLALLYKKSNDLQGSLDLLVQNICRCIQAIKVISKSDEQIQKSKIQLFSVVLVNGFKNAKDIASQLLHYVSSQERTEELNQMKYNFNKLGYEACVTYLGKKSYFTHFFEPIKKEKSSIQKNQNADTQTQQASMISINQKVFKSFESEMFSRLQTIEVMLKQKQTVTNTEQFSQPKETQIESSIVPTDQTPQVQQIQIQPNLIQSLSFSDVVTKILSFFTRNNKLDEVSFDINGWKIEVEFIKVFGQPLGKLEFKLNNSIKNLSLKHLIFGAQLMTLMHLTSLEDTMPYEHSLSDLPPNFITVCIKPYLSVSEEGGMEFYPKSKGLTKQFLETKFLGTNCYLSINHIKGTTFRIAISPIEESGSVYINAQFTEETMRDMMEELIDPIPSKIHEAYQKNFLTKKRKSQPKQSFKIKSIIVKNHDILETKVKSIVGNFEDFLLEDQQFFSGRDLLSVIDKQHTYFKYLQVDPINKGIFLRVNFLKNIKSFSVYSQETQLKVQASTKRKKISGAAIFDQTQFLQVFGFPMDEEQHGQKVKKIEEVICQKYYLNLRKLPNDLIRESYHFSTVENNYILEKSFTFQNFKVSFTTKEEESNYFQVITASIVTISNIYPIGIKINLYNPEDISSKGYFISLCPQDWKFDNIFQAKGEIVKGKQLNQPLEKAKSMFRKYNQKYGSELNYFLDYWMQKQGFKILLSKIIDHNSSLYLEKNLNSIVNWNLIFQE